MKREVPRSKDGRLLQSESGIQLKPFYEATDAPGHSDRPGDYPFTRGISPDMYRSEMWHIDMYAGFGNAEEARARYEFLLEQGASGVNIAMDLPTQLGYDSDHELAKGEVGRVGLAVDSLQDLQDVFQNTRLDQAKIVFTVANGIGPLALAWFMTVGDKQGVRREDYVIHLQNDPLKEYTGRGAYVLPLDPSLKLACDVIEFAARKGYRHWKPVGICGSQFRWGGSNAVQEVAFGLCEAITYIETLLARGLDVDSFAPMLELHLTTDIDLFEEVAKFRAVRRVWARLLKERYGARDPASCQLKISLYTAGYRLTKQEPLNNSVRITVQALAAILGGAQHIGTLSIDEALSTPSEESVRLALRTQQILAHEARVGHVADPLGGSFMVESLTNAVEEQIWVYIKEVDAMGGALQAIRNGYFQRYVDDGAYQHEKDVESGDRVVVGLNRFVDRRLIANSGIKPFKIRPQVEERQIERLKALRASRNPVEVGAALKALRDSARKGENVIEPLTRAVSAYATCGEIYDVFREVHGTYKDEKITL